jgi:hypothetical protein
MTQKGNFEFDMRDLRNYKTDGALVLASLWQAVNHLEDKETKLEVIEIAINYMFTGVRAESENSIVNIILTQALPNINAAQQRYDTACAANEKKGDGNNKGGRPRDLDYNAVMRMRDNSFSLGTIAKYFQCSDSAVKNIVYGRGKNNHTANKEGVSNSDSFKHLMIKRMRILKIKKK